MQKAPIKQKQNQHANGELACFLMCTSKINGKIWLTKRMTDCKIMETKSGKDPS